MVVINRVALIPALFDAGAGRPGKPRWTHVLPVRLHTSAGPAHWDPHARVVGELGAKRRSTPDRNCFSGYGPRLGCVQVCKALLPLRGVDHAHVCLGVSGCVGFEESRSYTPV